MSTANHTPVTFGAQITANNLNSPLGELDSAINAAGFADISARAYLSGDLTVATDDQTTVSWDAESYDTDNMHDNATTPHRITAQTAGKYIVSAQVVYSSDATDIQIRIHKNGSPSGTELAIQWHSAGDAASVTAHADLDVGDYVLVTIEHSSGGDRTALSGASKSWFAAQRISG